jgi:hypothetical protein
MEFFLPGKHTEKQTQKNFLKKYFLPETKTNNLFPPQNQKHKKTQK